MTIRLSAHRFARAFIAAMLASLFIIPAGFAQDFDEYTRLLERADASHSLLADAPEDRQEALAETALEADFALIEWLDAFISSDAFGQLGQEETDVVVSNRYRWEYNAAVLLIALDRCPEARDRVRTLLDSPISDAELRPRLTGAYEEAIACASRSRTASLVVEATPRNAEVYVDGVLAGLAGATLEVSEGPHDVTVRATGFTPQTLQISASENEEVRLGPVALLVAENAAAAPYWYEWTLWGVGVAGIATGVGYFMVADAQEEDIEAPPTGFRVANPADERATVDRIRNAAIATSVIGAGALIAGTVSFLTRDRSGGDDDALALEVGFGSVFLTGSF